MNGIKLLLLGIFISFFLFLPGFNTYFTNDDFYHLKISQAASLPAFINFFSPFGNPEKPGLYRPLTTQVYYWISVGFFHSDPLPLRIISFVFLLMISVEVYYLVFLLSGNRTASGFASLLFLLSATHFGHIYYAGTFQELGLAFFYLGSVILFWKHRYFSSLVLFIFALLSKETAVMLPLTLAGLAVMAGKGGTAKNSLLHILKVLIPYMLILAVYAVMRFRFYGFATGDSYIWVVSGGIFNTVAWYFLWCLNLPEMLVDFVGPGLHINPNLMLYWGGEMTAIFSLFAGFLLCLIYSAVRLPRSFYISVKSRLLFGVFWFIAALGPLLFLPWHKFTYNLTLPLVGVVYVLGLVLARTSRITAAVIVVFFLLLSVRTLALTAQTHWITHGAQAASNVTRYIRTNFGDRPAVTTLVFYDSPGDLGLPWSPSAVLKNVLSDNNYFAVFTGGRIRALYAGVSAVKMAPGWQLVAARQFLGY